MVYDCKTPIPHGVTLKPLTEEELAKEIIGNLGRCRLSGAYCEELCPISIQCLSMDKLAWARRILRGDESEGQCESIW